MTQRSYVEGTIASYLDKLASAEPEPGGGSVAALVGALGAGLELRLLVGRLNPLLGGELYALANISVGSSRVEGDPENDLLPLRWNPSLGMGARLGRAFGLLLALGVVADDNPISPIRPALSLEFGNLSDFLEDLR